MSEEEGREGPMRIDTDLIRQLADLLTEKDLAEIEVEDGERKVIVKRNTMTRDIAAAMSHAQPSAAPAPAAAPSPPLSTAEESSAAHPGAVKSPMVGTVYLSPEPGAPPFVAPGMRVEAGDTLLVIEAMKVMNPITAARAGVVSQVCVQDAEPVEYDQALMIIE